MLLEQVKNFSMFPYTNQYSIRVPYLGPCILPHFCLPCHFTMWAVVSIFCSFQLHLSFYHSFTTLFCHPLTLSSSGRSSAVFAPFVFDMSCECPILQALFLIIHLKKFQLKLSDSDSKCPAVNETKTKDTKANCLTIFATSEHNISDPEKGAQGEWF